MAYALHGAEGAVTVVVMGSHREEAVAMVQTFKLLVMVMDIGGAVTDVVGVVMDVVGVVMDAVGVVMDVKERRLGG